jgi:hypothetical protein
LGIFVFKVSGDGTELKIKINNKVPDPQGKLGELVFYSYIYLLPDKSTLVSMEQAL